MKPPFSVNDFKSRFLDGQRAYHFWIKIEWPGMANVLLSGLRDGLSQGIGDLQNAGKLAAAGAGTVAVDTIPFSLRTDEKNYPFYVRSTNLPDSNIKEIKTFWMGAEYKLASGITFDDWTVTFYIDKDGKLLRKFKEWQDIIINPQTNIASKPATYMVDQEAHLLNTQGETSCVYKFYGAWPKTISGVQLDYTNNEIATVDITFTYQYFMLYDTEQGALKEFGKKFVRSGVSGLPEQLL